MTVTDANGCITTDFIVITIDNFNETGVFIPNAFSPNGDGINDELMVFADNKIQQINVMKVFNRWGEEVFSMENFPANQAQFGWDGYFRTEKLNNAVFVYYVEVEYTTGRVEIFKGDVTLIR